MDVHVRPTYQIAQVGVLAASPSWLNQPLPHSCSPALIYLNPFSHHLWGCRNTCRAHLQGLLPGEGPRVDGTGAIIPALFRPPHSPVYYHHPSMSGQALAWQQSSVLVCLLGSEPSLCELMLSVATGIAPQKGGAIPSSSGGSPMPPGAHQDGAAGGRRCGALVWLHTRQWGMCARDVLSFEVRLSSGAGYDQSCTHCWASGATAPQ